MDAKLEIIHNAAEELMEFLRDFEVQNDLNSKSIFQRKIKQYEDYFLNYETKMSNMSNNNQSQIHQTQRQYINNSDPFKNTNYLKQENQYMPRINKFHDNEYQNLSYKQPYEPINSMKMANDTRANAKIYGERNVTFNNEPMIQPLFPKQFLENNLILSKQLIQKAPQDYRYILSRNIQNLGGIEDTISKMEETLRENELRKVYSYCELDDPKYMRFYGSTDIVNPFLRREYHEIDFNSRGFDERKKVNFKKENT